MLIIMKNSKYKIPIKILALFSLAFFYFISEIFTLPIFAQENFIIRKIKFIDNESFSSGKLSSLMTLKGTSRFQQIILRRKAVHFDEKIFQQDIVRIQKFYQSEGFLEVAVTYQLQPHPKRNSVIITIKIDEHEPIIVREISFHFRTKNDTTAGKSPQQLIDRMESSFRLRHGKRFRDILLRTDRDLILKKFSNEGYPYVQAQPEFRIDNENNFVDINYQIDSGDFCYFGDITIAQNKRTAGTVIRKQLSIKEGDVFKQHLIERSQLQVYQIGFFQSVTIKAMMNERKNDAVPIQILVREAPRLTMKVGYGYGIEENIRVYTDILRMGFLGGARRMNLFVKHSKLEPYNVNLKFTQPAFIKPRTTLLLNSFVKREDEPGYELSRVGGTLTLQQQFSSRTNAYLSYILEQDNLEISPETQEQILNNIDLSYYNKSTVKIGLIRDISGPIFSPNHGFFAALDYTLSGLDFNSKFDFTKVLFEFRNYQQVNRSLVFASKIKFGVMKPIMGDDVTPIEERFFSGGSMSVRGWQRSQLGPKNAENDPLGGNSLLECSAEIRYPIWKIFSGVAFLDFGNVWNKAFDQRLSDLRYATGPGLRIDTPIGPIRFDVAKPIWDIEKAVQFHLSVGQAF